MLLYNDSLDLFVFAGGRGASLQANYLNNWWETRASEMDPQETGCGGHGTGIALRDDNKNSRLNSH